MTNQACNCALPALTGNYKCCEHCNNNPNRYENEHLFYQDTLLSPEQIEQILKRANQPITFIDKEEPKKDEFYWACLQILSSICELLEKNNPTIKISNEDIRNFYKEMKNNYLPLLNTIMDKEN